MAARVSAFVIWALVAGSAMYWLLGTLRGPVAPSYTVPVAESAAMRGELARLLGGAAVAAAPEAAPPSDSRFKLVGVVAPRAGGPGGSGVAVIVVGDKPPRPYRVGATIDGQLTLRSVAMRSVSIGPAKGGGGFTLELPAPTAAATGTLPPASMDSPQAVMPAGVYAPPPPPPQDASVPPAAYEVPPMPEPMPEYVEVPPPPPGMEGEQVMPVFPDGDGRPPPGQDLPQVN